MRDPKYYRKFNYRRSLLPNAHLAQMEESVSTIEEAIANSGYSIGYPGWGVIYYLLLAHLDPETENIIIETGSSQGASTIVLVQALVDSGAPGHVHSIELVEENIVIAQANLIKAGVAEHATLHLGDAKEKLAAIITDLGTIRAAFLDGSHLLNDVLEEFSLIQANLHPQGVVFFDNTYNIAEDGEDQRVNGALKEIQARYGGNIINLEFVSWYTPGLAIWQKAPFDGEAR